MKITLVSHQVGRNDGQGRVNYEIVRGLLSAGWDVTIVAMRCADDLKANKSVRFVSFNVEKLPTQLLRSFAFAVASAIWLRRNRKQTDVLHLNGALTWISSDVNAAHFVHGAWLRHDFFPFNKKLSLYSGYQRLYTSVSAKWELPAFLQARSVVAVSNKVASELESIGVPKDSISVIYNGVDTEEFFPGEPVRELFNLPMGVPIFLFAGDIRTRRKNLDTVLSALSKVPDLHLVVAGETVGSPFPELAEKLGLTARVQFLGKVTKMASLMRSVDALVFPSRYECMSLVLLEALASGLPILTAETAGGAEIVGSAGQVLKNPDDAETLAQWMNDLKEDKNLRLSMGAAGRKIALEHNWPKMAEEYKDLYIQVRAQRRLELNNHFKHLQRGV